MGSTQVLYIMQGAPGSGKSTVARAIRLSVPCYEIEICSTDDFCMVDGKYCWEADKQKSRHQQNQAKVNDLLEKGISVIVDNTNTRQFEAQPYIDMAKRLGIPIQVVSVDGRFPNSHGVPEETVQAMRDRMERLKID